MVHDGWVMAIRHRQGRAGYESTAGYGSYRWGATTWTYGYERSEDRRGRPRRSCAWRARPVKTLTSQMSSPLM